MAQEPAAHLGEVAAGEVVGDGGAPEVGPVAREVHVLVVDDRQPDAPDVAADRVQETEDLDDREEEDERHSAAKRRTVVGDATRNFGFR